MAVKRGDDSKQGLIIALVFFVLLAIGLGVATYYGFEGQQALRDKLKKAEADTATFKKNRDWEQFQKLYLKASVGEPFSEAEKEKDAFTDYIARYNNKQLGDDKERAEFEPLFEKLKKALKWEGDQPKATYAARVAELEAGLRQKDELLAKTQEDSKAAQKKFDEDLAALQKSAKKLGDELAKANKDLADQRNEKSKEYLDVLKKVEDANTTVDKTKREKEDLKDELTKTINKQAKTLKEKDTQIGKLQDQIKPPNVLDYDKPKGKIQSVERSGQTVYIDLGSADNVKPQLTFSIYGVGPDGKPSAQRKGALEVANVLSSHQSRARITEMTDPNRDPVLVGDLLFNPVWSPTLKTHVAIAGVIDLTGEGTDNTAEFIRGLERQGIIVDAWLDLKDLSIKGAGVSLKTNYLVLGDRPEFADVPTNSSDRLTTDKTNLIKKMSEMQDEAIKLGVSVIPFRRFLAVIGYPLPRVLTTRSNPAGYLDSLLLSTGAKRHENDQEKGDKDGKDKGAPKGKGKADKEEMKEKEK